MFKWASLFARKEAEQDIFSPNGRIKCRVTLNGGRISYAVYKNDKPILRPSKLGIDICGEHPLGDNLTLIRAQRKKHTETFELP